MIFRYSCSSEELLSIYLKAKAEKSEDSKHSRRLSTITNIEKNVMPWNPRLNKVIFFLHLALKTSTCVHQLFYILMYLTFSIHMYFHLFSGLEKLGL